MKKPFSISLPVRFEDVDRHRQAKPLALLAAMQEAAVMHAESLGRGFDWLRERNWAWMLVQTRLRIERQPAWREQMQVCTWPGEMGRMLSVREFQIFCQGRLAASATTLWAFVDRARGRVCRVPPELAQAFEPDLQRALEGGFRRPKRPTQEPDWRLRQTRKVRLGDLDANEHVNNLRVVGWLLHTLPDEHLSGRRLVELELRYIEEMHRCQVLRITHEAFDGGARIHHQVKRDDGPVAVAAESRWKPI